MGLAHGRSFHSRGIDGNQGEDGFHLGKMCVCRGARSVFLHFHIHFSET